MHGKENITGGDFNIIILMSSNTKPPLIMASKMTTDIK